MPDASPIVIPRENVNDESVKLLAWLVADKEPVQAGQAIAEIESSKTVAEIVAPMAGTLNHVHRVGDEVAVGGVLGHITTGDTALTPTAPAIPAAAIASTAAPLNGSASHAATPPAEASPAVIATHSIETRFSAKAQELLKLHAVDPARFNNRGLVRAEDVQAILDGKPLTTQPQKKPAATASPAIQTAEPPAVTGAAGVPIRSEPLSRSKKVEARYLSSALRSGLPSVITVAVPTRGLQRALAAHASLRGQISPIIIFEAARILKGYPAFNAFCSDGSAHFYEQVNIGFAVDADRGLKVPVIRDADTKSLPEIAAEMQELVVDYLNDSLPMKALAGGTFTITDLSGDGVFGFHPLINQGQSAILGIGGEFFAPGSKEGMFNLILAFDHQISEGRAAARFLNELKRRIVGYESALTASAASTAPSEEPSCERCFTGLAELTSTQHYLLQTAGPNGTTRNICTRCAMGYT
jgi:pyruvate/2-oxoglutarate dehydrogenase complex dihydrolipoamide acyltransferase (E2) component